MEQKLVQRCETEIVADACNASYSDIPNRVNDTVWNITITKGKIILQNVLITHFLYHKGI